MTAESDSVRSGQRRRFLQASGLTALTLAAAPLRVGRADDLLIPQAEVDYAISYDSQNVYTSPRRDGLIVQEWSPGDYGNDKEERNLEATRASVEKIARLCAQMGR